MSGYRDPLEAARSKMEAALERAAERESLLTTVLQRELPKKLRERLLRARDRAMAEAHDLDAVRAREQALDRYRQVIDEALSRVPRIDRRINRLPDAFPERIRPHFRYFDVDIYSGWVQDVRRRVHERVKRLASQVTFQDDVGRYFDHQEDPYLVEACFVVERTPLRLHVVIIAEAYYESVVGFSMLTLLRKSAPAFSLKPQGWHTGVLKAIGLQEDLELGLPKIEDAFIIEGDGADVLRVLDDAMQTALLDLAMVDVPRLEVHDGLARLEWVEPLDCGGGIEPACAVMRELRAMPPTPLLAKER
jgi:hypothetical protein